MPDPLASAGERARDSNRKTVRANAPPIKRKPEVDLQGPRPHSYNEHTHVDLRKTTFCAWIAWTRLQQLPSSPNKDEPEHESRRLPGPGGTKSTKASERCPALSWGSAFVKEAITCTAVRIVQFHARPHRLLWTASYLPKPFHALAAVAADSRTHNSYHSRLFASTPHPGQTAWE